MQYLQMKTALALTVAAAIAASISGPAQARDRWPAVPEEVGVHQIGHVGWISYRCADRPVLNFYHGAYYDAPPAIYRDYAYRPYYRYTAYRVVPRTHFCSEK
jgi:hypothetical protein